MIVSRENFIVVASIDGGADLTLAGGWSREEGRASQWLSSGFLSIVCTGTLASLPLGFRGEVR
jgi:hypothetical protein